MTGGYRVVFGDIHNHNAHGYGQGSIERSIDIARTHLDFYAFTGHSSWHDLEVSGTDERFLHFTRGFERLAETWSRVQRAIASANRDGEFAAFLGFEWHSNFYGDQCVIFRDDDKPISYAKNFDELKAFCQIHGAMLLPHHVGYPRGVRGANWDVYDPQFAPVVEIYSMHGCSETDRSPYPMKLGSPGGRSTENTVAAALRRGHRFGFTASTDSHRGFPGAWGEGLTAALVKNLDRESIWDAFWNRRTYALTGDRIEIDFSVDGAVMGSTLTTRPSVEVAFAVAARDEIALVEIIHDGEVAEQFRPPRATSTFNWAQPFQLRFEWGWGPWADLDKPRTIDWDFRLEIDKGQLDRHYPCLASHPFDEHRRHRFAGNDNRLHVTSYTSRAGAFNGNPNQAVVIEGRGTPQSKLLLSMTQPVETKRTIGLDKLALRSVEDHIGPYPSESYQFHRLVDRRESHLTGSAMVPLNAEAGHVYLRVTQKNGQMAWTSPVFIGPDRPQLRDPTL